MSQDGRAELPLGQGLHVERHAAERVPVASGILEQRLVLAQPDVAAAAALPLVEDDPGDLPTFARAGSVAEEKARCIGGTIVGNLQRSALPRDDPMLQRLDLAYALNAHMAQGLTSDRGIAVMETRDTKLANQQTFLVTVTRLRDALTLVVDGASKLERQLSRNPGGNSSALETTGNVRGDLVATGERSPQDKVPVPPEKSIEADQGRLKPYEIGI